MTLLGSRLFGDFLGIVISSKILEIDPLDDSHLSGVGHAGTKLGDASVSTGALTNSRSNHVEKTFHGILLAKETQSHPAGVDVVLLSKGDHLLHDRADGLCLGKGGTDSAVLDQSASLVSQESVPVSVAALQSDGFFAMSHRIKIFLNGRVYLLIEILGDEIGQSHRSLLFDTETWSHWGSQIHSGKEGGI